MNRSMRIIMKCIGYSIAVVFLCSYFFVPALFVLWFAIAFISGGTINGDTMGIILAIPTVVYCIVCISYSCYLVGAGKSL